MKNKNFACLIAVSALIAAPLKAGDFEDGLRAVQDAAAAAKTSAADQSTTPSAVPGTRWWSVNFFGSAHRAIGKAALAYVDKNAYSDIGAAKSDLLDGFNDESGHPDSTMNGGRVEDLWYGLKPETKGGVLRNYRGFDFHKAYERLGTVGHLTQDQAVPTHAANIKHSFNDSFEGFYDNIEKISGLRYDPALPPYAYYQKVQDETRSKLAGWKDNGGRQYWVPSADAPRMGEDATFGPRGHYGGDHNRDVFAVPPQNNNDDSQSNAWTSDHPEIRLQQLAAAGEATVELLQSASRTLPPLVDNLTSSSFSVERGSANKALIRFTAYDNRSDWVTYNIAVYKDGVKVGDGPTGQVALGARDHETGIMKTGDGIALWDGTVNGVTLEPGAYTLDVRLTDTDGNVTPDALDAAPGSRGVTTLAFTLK